MVLTDLIMTCLRRVIEYNYENEKKHFEECEEEEQENDIKVGDNVRLKEIGKYVRSIDDYPNNTRYYSFEFNKYNYFNNIQKVMKIKTRKDGEKVMKIGDKWPWFECSYWKAYD